MKIKKQYYCITDNYNKPDFRFLFQDEKDAAKKIKQIKNSTRGETLFISKYKRDFFVDGIKKNFIGSRKKIQIRKGCWTSLQVKKLFLLESVKPEALFKQTTASQNFILSYSKTRQRESLVGGLGKINSPIAEPIIAPFQKVDWQNSFLTTRGFATVVATLVIVAIASIFSFNHRTNTKIAEMMLQSHALTTQKAIEGQAKIIENKDQERSEQFDQDLNKFVLSTLKSFENLKQEEFEKEIIRIIKGSPMEKMAPLIAKQDRTVAAFLVGIAKKESNFGRRVPVLNGEDCFNYWGYRGIRTRMGSGGHTCFDSPQDAIETVGGRLGRLVSADVDTPQEMVLWKCGSACASDSGAQKWIDDVSSYFSELKKDNS